jgi:hypothetical protein
VRVVAVRYVRKWQLWHEEGGGQPYPGRVTHHHHKAKDGQRRACVRYCSLTVGA